MLAQQLASLCHMTALIVWLAATAQDQVAVGVAMAAHQCQLAITGRLGIEVGRPAGEDRLYRDPDIAVGTVFKADGAGKGRGQLAVELGFGGASANGPPADEIPQIEHAGEIEKFGGTGEPFLSKGQK